MSSNKKKRLNLALLALAMSLALSACGSGNTNNNSNTEPGASEDSTEIVSPVETPEPVPTPTSEPEEDGSSAVEPQPSELPSESESPPESSKPTEPPGTTLPSSKPSPTAKPTQQPTDKPIQQPTAKPTQQPTQKPTQEPSIKPSATPGPSQMPTQKPTEKPNPAPDVKVQDIVDKITSDLEIAGQMTVDKSMIPDFYNGIDPDQILDEHIFQQPSFMISASEFSVVRLKSDDHYDTMKEAFEFRAETVQKSFESYLPDQYKLSQNYKIVRSGNYILFVISSKQDDMIEIFNSFFNK